MLLLASSLPRRVGDLHQRALAYQAVGLAGGLAAELSVGKEVDGSGQTVGVPAPGLATETFGQLKKNRWLKPLHGGIQRGPAGNFPAHQVEPLEMPLAGA